MIDTGGPNALVRACFEMRNGTFLVTVQMNRSAGGSILTPTATIFTLSGHVCKWPIGDPSSEGFGFCGRRRERGSYCEHHAGIGYTPLTKNRTGNELARSLRRYC